MKKSVLAFSLVGAARPLHLMQKSDSQLNSS